LDNKTLNSFWLPSLTPEGKTDKLAKPSKVNKSPFRNPISLKSLTPLVLTPNPDVDQSGTGRYMCPTCKKSLNTVSGVSCIRTTGHVFCSTCMEKYIKKDMTCPITSSRFDEEDILQLESEGSSFSSRTGTKLVATTKGPVARFG